MNELYESLKRRNITWEKLSNCRDYLRQLCDDFGIIGFDVDDDMIREILHYHQTNPIMPLSDILVDGIPIHLLCPKEIKFHLKCHGIEETSSDPIVLIARLYKTLIHLGRVMYAFQINYANQYLIDYFFKMEMMYSRKSGNSRNLKFQANLFKKIQDILKGIPYRIQGGYELSSYKGIGKKTCHYIDQILVDKC